MFIINQKNSTIFVTKITIEIPLSSAFKGIQTYVVKIYIASHLYGHLSTISMVCHVPRAPSNSYVSNIYNFDNYDFHITMHHTLILRY